MVKAKTLTLSMNNSLESILLSRGVAERDIEKAQAYREKFGGNLENLLVNLGSLDEDQLAEIYSEYLSIELLTSADDVDEIPSQLLEQFNLDFLAKRDWFPYRELDDKLCFATRDPLNWEANQYLEGQNLPFLLKVCGESVLDQIRAKSTSETEKSLESEYSELSELEEDKIRELASEAPVVNLLNSLIARGLKLGASDMHVEPVEGRCRVRYRIDGVLHDAETIPKRLQLPVASRLKILSGMDIAEKRRPQDGKIETRIANIELDIRVSALPLNEGESIVLRFLKKDSVRYDMNVLGICRYPQCLDGRLGINLWCGSADRADRIG